MTPDIFSTSLTQIRLQIPIWLTNGGCETLQLAVTQPFINIETSFFHEIVRNDTGHQLQKFDTNRITNSKMLDKTAVVQMHGCISSVYISFQVV